MWVRSFFTFSELALIQALTVSAGSGALYNLVLLLTWIWLSFVVVHSVNWMRLFSRSERAWFLILVPETEALPWPGLILTSW